MDAKIECTDCMWEARATHGIYDMLLNEKIPKNLRKKVQESYEDQLYWNHEKADLRKVVR